MRRRIQPVSIPNEQFTYRPSLGVMVTVFARQLRCHRVLRKADPYRVRASSAISLTRRMGGSDLVGDLKLVNREGSCRARYVSCSRANVQ